MKTFIPLFIVALTMFALQPIHAQSDTSGPVNPTAQPPPADVAPPAAPSSAPPPSEPAGTGTSSFSNSATQAVDLAQQSVEASVRDHIVSVYGVGTPTAVTRWWVIFYDPTVSSHGRAVRIENGQVAKTYEAQGGVVYQQDLTFNRDRVSDESAALENAQNYATQQHITYDGVRALLRRNSTEGPLRWRVQLLRGEKSRGFVFTNSSNGSFAMYSPANSAVSGRRAHTGGGGGGGGGVQGDLEGFGNDVKHTFLGIGGDLQEFFTGERTVDQ